MIPAFFAKRLSFRAKLQGNTKPVPLLSHGTVGSHKERGFHPLITGDEIAPVILKHESALNVKLLSIISVLHF